MSYDVPDDFDARCEQLINTVHDRDFDEPIDLPAPPTKTAVVQVEDPQLSGIAAALARADAQYEREETPLIEYQTLEELQASLAAEPDEELPDPDYGVLEQSIIDLVLDSPDLIGQHNVRLLQPIHFKDHAHRCIIVAWLELWDQYQQAPTRLLVHNQVLRMKPDEVEGVREAAVLAEKSHSTALEREVARKHLGDWMKRQIVKELHTEEAFMILRNCGPEAFASWVRTVMDRANKVGTGASKKRFQTISAAELATTDYNINFLIDGILVEKQPMMIAGPMKSLKTSISVDLALSLATGGYFLGRFPVQRPLRTGLLSSESGMGTIQDVALRVCKVIRKPLSEIENTAFCDTVPQINNPADLEEFATWLKEEKLDVCILDPFYLMADGEGAGNMFLMGQQLRTLAEMCVEHGATPIILHHLKKSRLNPHEPASLEDAAWAGIAEFCRQWILLSRRTPYQGDGHHELWMNVGGSAGHSSQWSLTIDEGLREDVGGRRWGVDLVQAIEAKAVALEEKQEAKANQDEQAILKALATLGPMTGNKLATAAKIGKGRINSVLIGMVDRELLETKQVIIRNNLTTEFSLVGSPGSPTTDLGN